MTSKFNGDSEFRHDRPDRIGVLITNLGTPDEPTPSALRRYLAQFLWDPRVVEVPRPIWWLVLHGVILRFRPKRSAHAYQQIWTDRGSPLLYHTQDQCDALARHFKSQYGDAVRVTFAMRYGNPSISEALDRLAAEGVRKLVVLPLYPQYSATTSGSTFDAISQHAQRQRWIPDIRFVSHYHDHPAYIEAMAKHLEQYWQKHPFRGEGRENAKLILSYHGVPQKYLHRGDPYHCECHATSRLLAERLGLGPDAVMTTFQSRFGREPWLQPYTDHTLKKLASDGVKAVQVFCPGFASDCLETVEEIDQENRGYFMEAGGKSFDYIPALNAEPVHIEAMTEILEQNLKGWVFTSPEEQPLTKRCQRAQKLGAER